MMRRRGRRRTARAIGIVGLRLGLAACGDDAGAQGRAQQAERVPAVHFSHFGSFVSASPKPPRESALAERAQA